MATILEQKAVANGALLNLVTIFVTAAHFFCGEAATSRPDPNRITGAESFMMR